MADAAFLKGGGKASDLIRARDWSAHPLGEPATWSDGLATALSLVLNSPESMILCWGPDLHFFFNEAYFPLLGPRLDWAMGERFDRVWADGLEQAMPIIEAAIAGNSERFVDLPWRLDTDRGSADTWWSFSYSRVLDRHGDVSGVFIFTNETTKRVRSDAALAHSQAELTTALEEVRAFNQTLEARVAERTAERNLLATLIETTDSLVNALDRDYRWLAINRAAAAGFERAFGVRPAVGDNMLELLAERPDDRAAVQALWGRALAGEEFTAIADFGDDPRSYEIKFNILRDAAGATIGAFQIVSDVTDRLRAEAQLAATQEALRQSQKMEAIGQLTGGVAHDFNNLLTPIMGSLDLIQRRATLSPRHAMLIDGALQSADRAKTLVQRLLAFARRQPLRAAAIDIAALVGGLTDLVKSTVGPQIDVRVLLGKALPPALADANQLEMAILNLCINARDAMSGDGSISIAVDVETLADGNPQRLSPGRYVMLSVIDTGTGMDADTMRRAAEPFFSTKGVGKGTGLGLSMVHGLALQLGGAMAIASQPGEGTRVDLWLPASDDAAPIYQGAGEPGDTPRFSGTALVVDDESLVRATTASMLQNLGFETQEVDNAVEAARRIDAGVRYDVVVTDHLMPGMSGAELAGLIGARWPHFPVLIVSGYADVGNIAPGTPRLAKPFREADLAQAIAALT